MLSNLSTEDIIFNLNYAERKVQQIENQQILFREALELKKTTMEQLQKNIALIQMSRDYYDKAVDLVCAASVTVLEELLNTALLYIFTDKKYTIHIVLDSKRKSKNMTFILQDHSFSPPVEVDIKNGIGAGVRVVISFVIHFFYILRSGSYPILFVDEEYSQISSDYIDRFFSFVKDLCHVQGFGLVLISHDLPRIEQYADKVYLVSDGRVREYNELSNLVGDDGNN